VSAFERSCQNSPDAAFIAGGCVYPYFSDVVSVRSHLVFTAESSDFVRVTAAAFEQTLRSQSRSIVKIFWTSIIGFFFPSIVFCRFGKNTKTAPLKTVESNHTKTVETDPLKTVETAPLKTL
jgi:hypothetical protein